MPTEITTGNKIVDEISRLNINSIPEAWYSTIRRKDYPHAMAILILWDLLYWYKWTEVRKESSGMVIGYKKKFHADLLQRSYSAIADKFGISKRQAQEIIIFLEGLGALKRHLKSVATQDRVIPNVLFIELIPSKIKELSDPSHIIVKDTSQDDGEYITQSCEVSSISMEDTPTQLCETNTTNSTTNSTTTSTSVYDDSLCSSSSAADEPPLEKQEDDATPPWEKNLKSTGLVKASEYHADNKPLVKKTKTRKPRVPLSDREPVNDIERVEKAYMKAWEEARKKKPSLSKEPVSGFKTFGSQRKMIKSWLTSRDVDSVINAVLLSAKDDFCRNTLDMRLRSIMSEGVFCRLLDGRIQGESYGQQQKREAFVDGKERDYSDTDF